MSKNTQAIIYDDKLQKWFADVKHSYDCIIVDISKYAPFDVLRNVMIDLDETILYRTNNQIPYSIEFIKILNLYFNVYFVSGRIDVGERRKETIHDIINYKYTKLLMRPLGEAHATFKLRIKKEINAIFSVGDQLTDYPEYLIPNPFYTIDAAGDEHIIE